MQILAAGFWSQLYHALYPDHIYKHIPTNALMNLDFILIALYAAIVVAAAMSCYNRAHMGRLIRGLIKGEAFSADKALSLKDLGLEGSRGIASALRNRRFGFTVRRADIDYKALFASSGAMKAAAAKKGRKVTKKVARPGEDSTVVGDNPGDFPFSAEEMSRARAAYFKKKFTSEEWGALKFYIPEDVRYSAEDRWSRRGSDVRTVILWAILLIPVFMLVRFFLPEILQFADNAVGMMVE